MISINRNKIDKILLNKTFGIPLFFLVIWVVFQSVFTIGQIPMDIINWGISEFQDWLTVVLPTSLWSSLLIDGVIGGVGVMLVFLPLIMILFFFISFLGQSGYLIRIAFLFEKTLSKIGLSGKAVVPLSMGFGCNVPAIMALKTLENRRQRIIAAMMIPFLSCSATLPIYTLITAAFFEEKWRGIILFGLYGAGVVFSFITGLILNKLLKPVKRKKDLALPDYKMPKMKNILASISSTTKSFLSKAGKIILPFSIIMWFLFTFPQIDGHPAQIEESYAAQIGMAVEPVFEPIGFNWRINTALLGSLGAKEIFISTLGVFYSLDTNTEDGLIEALQNDGSITPLTAMIILIFMLIYSPCIPALATIKEELSIRWALVAFFYPLTLAWLVCFLVFQVAVSLGMG